MAPVRSCLGCSWAALLSVVVLASPLSARACLEEFPLSLLADGDQGLLLSPRAAFEAELSRMNLARTRWVARPVSGEADVKAYAEQSQQGETDDLIDALLTLGQDDAKVLAICAAHQEQRQKLSTFQAEMSGWSAGWAEPDPEQRPKFPALAPVRGLPPEFALYFAGLITWHNPEIKDKGRARESWVTLLSLPPDQRRYKSTWAAYMLGKSWEKEDPNKATALFRQVRDLVRQGFKDSIGLAAASVGLEARVQLGRSDFLAAIDLYLEQLASGDPSATNSLRMTAQQALADSPETLIKLAKQPRAQQLITAYLISQNCSRWYSWDDDAAGESGDEEEIKSPAQLWLEATEAAGVRDVASAEMLALAAYQHGEIDAAQRWTRRASTSPVAQWLQAKLLLREGKVDTAAALLARLLPHFPLNEPDRAAVPQFKDTLWVKGQYYEQLTVSRLVHAEAAVLRLARGEYVQALDAMLNAGIWADAAYVAERVLTLEELKEYVDSFWPAGEANDESSRSDFRATDMGNVRKQIRYLLARRLTRALRGDLAAAYYPPEWAPKFAELACHLQTGWDETLEPGTRADALFQAALITRTNGLELIGTEVQPDWNIHDGQFEEGVTHERRTSQVDTEQIHAQPDELERARSHNADPEERFHYRYHAAALAWEAAKLLPDNTDLTARILWTGGTFLKNRDPYAADVFYKALVNRNRKTALGDAADKQRWFPRLDSEGNILPRNVIAPSEPLPEGLEPEMIVPEPVPDEPAEIDVGVP